MKNLFLLFTIVIILASLTSAACDLDIVLVNQDPSPAMPGDYVKVVFQVSGLQSPDCGTVNFWIEEDFPFSLDPGVEKQVTMRSGTYVKDYRNFFLVPYKLRVHENAVDGENEIPVKYSVSSDYESRFFLEKFNITVEDSRTDFEVHIKDYSSKTKKVVFEILNIGENDVEGFTIDFPKQENAKIYGTNRIIIGDLNSNEEDSATFEVDLEEGEIKIDISYTDQIGERRKLEKVAYFDPSYFYEAEEESTISPTISFIIGFLIPLIFFFVRSKIKKRKEKLKKHGAIRF